MKRRSFQFHLTVAVLITIMSVGRSFAQSNTHYGDGALISPLSADLSDSAFGFRALNTPTSGTNNTAIGAAALLSNTTAGLRFRAK